MERGCVLAFFTVEIFILISM